MNPRIKELASQCWDQRLYGRHFDQEKFAELIVQECIDIVAPSNYRRAYPENYLGGIDCLYTLDDRVRKIKQHFGIDNN